MRIRKCWICGKDIKQSAVGQSHPFYLEVRIITVNRPYATNHKSGFVYVCDECANDKIGMTYQGKNINFTELEPESEKND